MDSFPSKPEERPPYQQYDWRGDWLLALVFLTGIVLLISTYAGNLNTIFYESNSPFYDSASYASYVASVVGLVETQGIGAGLVYALNGATTPLPGIEAAFLARFGFVYTPVHRHLGIKLQIFWVWVFVAVTYLYWFGFRKVSAWPAVALTLPFINFAGFWAFNGGISDFRMDLLLYVFFSLTVVIYLMTEETDSFAMWGAMGVAAALGCLSRATAPVYLLVALGPPFAVRLWSAPNSARRLRLVKQALFAVAIIALLAFSYFAYSFKDLYYYYVVWSADANANLPWSQSIRHYGFALASLGRTLEITGAMYAAAILIENLGALRERGWLGALRSIDWKLLYIGMAPATFLAWRGAGWNPFVAMPSIFGWMMFLLAPLKGSPAPLRTPLSAIALGAVMLAVGWNALHAPQWHQPVWPQRMSAIKAGIDAMQADAKAKNLQEVRFTGIHLWFYHPAFVRDSLIHEYGARAFPKWVVMPDGSKWYAYLEERFAVATKLDWQQLPGTSDDEKIEYLVGEARAKVDYLLMPEDATVDNAEREIAHNYANLVVRRVKQRLVATGEWEPITGPLEISPKESVRIFTKRRGP